MTTTASPPDPVVSDTLALPAEIVKLVDLIVAKLLPEIETLIGNAIPGGSVVEGLIAPVVNTAIQDAIAPMNTLIQEALSSVATKVATLEKRIGI